MVFEFLNKNQERVSLIIRDGVKKDDVDFVKSLLPEIELMDKDMTDCITGSTFRVVNSLGVLAEFDIPYNNFKALIVNPAIFDVENINLVDLLETKFNALVKTREFIELKESRKRFVFSFLSYLKELQLNYYKSFWATKITINYARYHVDELAKTKEELRLCNEKLVNMRLENKLIKNKSKKYKQKNSLLLQVLPEPEIKKEGDLNEFTQSDDA